MHGQHCEERQQTRHMWPAPSERPALCTFDSSGVNWFSKDGRKITVGDCALFQAGNAPPFIGIIRKLSPEKEGNLKLVVNWLYRPADVKLAKGVPRESAPNEIFYSFHKDEISAASLLHPCKVAFLRKGVELPAGVSSFVCRRVYDTSHKCLWWLTDRDYTDEHQEEVDQLLDRTKHEMQATVQAGGSSSRALTGSTSSQQQKASSDVQNAAQSKGKKRERTDQTLDLSKRERSLKSEENDSGHVKEECSMKLDEIANIVDKDGGVGNLPGVDQLVHLMQQERNDSVKKAGDVALRRAMLASVIAATEREECLNQFVQLGGLPMLDDWLQEAHKGKVGDGGSPKEGDKGIEELLLTLLRALDKLPVDLDALKTCMVGKSVNNLRGHKNMEIQKKARKLVDTWKKRVDAEMKGESKSGSSPASQWTSKQPSIDLAQTNPAKVGPTVEANVKSTAGSKPISNGSCPGDSTPKSGPVSAGGCKTFSVLSPIVACKENHAKAQGSGTADLPAMLVKEEKSSSSSQSQNNSQSFSSGPVKNSVSAWKEEGRNPSMISAGAKAIISTVRNHNFTGKAHPSAVSTGSQKELVGGKPLVWSRNAVHEKTASSGGMDKVSIESFRADNTNNQRLIVRLPNPGRSPARSASGGSFVDMPASNSRGSSPNSSERHDLTDGKSRMHNSISVVHSPEASTGARYAANGGKMGAGCGDDKERSISAIPADKVECRTSDVEEKPEEALAVDGQNGTPAVLAATTSPDACPARSGTNMDGGGIDLLASVAASESSEVGKNVVSGTTERQDSHVVDSSREPERPLTDAESLNQTLSLHGGDKKENDGDGLIDSKNLPLELGCTVEKGETRLFPGQEARGTTEADSQRVPSEIQLMPDNEGNSECTPVFGEISLVKDIAVASGKGANDSVVSQDDCEGTKVERREAGFEEKSTMAGTDLCPASSLTGQHCTRTEVHMEIDSSEEAVGEKLVTSSGTLIRMSSGRDVQKAAEVVSAYYEDDALEVARQVAKEVEQEVERYGKPDAQDMKSDGVCANEQRFDAKKSWCSSSGLETGLKGEDGNCQNPQDTGAVADSDDSQETVTERREETDGDKTAAAGEGEEVDQAPNNLSSPDMTKMALDSAPGSVVDACNEEKGTVSGAEQSPSLQSSMAQQVLISAAGNVLPGATSGVEKAVASAVSKEGSCGAAEAPGRPVFDLNEGLIAEEANQDDAMIPMASPVNPATLHPITPAVTATPNGVAAPIAVVAAAKGVFIPPTNPLRKGEPGWKGSAATSAFRPAEPRRTPERMQLTADIPDAAGVSGKRARPLNIDLNVADEIDVEEASVAATFPPQSSTFPTQGSILGPSIHTSSPSSISQAAATLSASFLSSEWLGNGSRALGRPELDLNRVDESDDGTTQLVTDSPGVEGFASSTRITSGSSFASTRVMRDFDLNDGPLLEEVTGDEPALQQISIKSLGTPALPVVAGTRLNLEVVDVAPWFPLGDTPPTLAMPAFTAARAEASYPVVAAATAKSVLSTGPVLSSFSGDLYRAGAVIPASPAVSYSTTMPAAFPYPGFPFGSSFPFTSASFATSTTPYLESSSSPFSVVPSQLVSAGAIVSPYGRPYLIGMADVIGAENGAAWLRPNLDLNTGPELVEADTREDGVNPRLAPFSQLSFQQAGAPGGSLKRKEPEGGFDPYRSGFKQAAWR